MSTCQGSGQTVEAVPYNAKGRDMHLATCPVCGREFRRQGRASGRVALPVHDGAKPAPGTFRRELAGGLTVAVDPSTNVVIEATYPTVTVTNVAGLIAALDDARTFARVLQENA